MTVMRAVGNGHRLPAGVSVREQPAEYVVELAVPDFSKTELAVEALGPRVTVRGDQQETSEDGGQAFRLHARLEETFRLPDDADADRIKVFYKHGKLEIHAPRTSDAPRQLPIEHPPYFVNPEAEAC